MNQIKAITRAGMGACGGETCDRLVKHLFQAGGVPLTEVTENTLHPLIVDVPLGAFAGAHRPVAMVEEKYVVRASDAHEGGQQPTS